MKNFAFVFLIIFILHFAPLSANIWDNLFFEQNMDLKIPDEFILIGNSQTTIGTLDLSLSVSFILKKIYLSVTVNAFRNRNAFEAILDSKSKLLTFHTLVNSCTKIGINDQISMLFDDSSSYSNLALMFLDREKEGRYIVVDTQQIFDSLDLPGDLYIYYDEKNNLKKIKIDLEENRTVEFDITEIKKTTFTESDFLVPQSWNCEKVKVKSPEDIRTEDFIGDGLIDLQNFLKNFNSPSNNFADELKKFISNNSP